MLDLSYSGEPIYFWDGAHMGLAQLTVTDGSAFLSWVKNPLDSAKKPNRIFTGFTESIGVCVRDLVLLRPDLTVEETNTLRWFRRTQAAPPERVAAEVAFSGTNAVWYCPTCGWRRLVYHAGPKPNITLLDLTPARPGDLNNYNSDPQCKCCGQQWKISISGMHRIAEICLDRKNIWWKRCC